MQTLAQALAQAFALAVPRLDAQRLLLHALGQPVTARAWLLAHEHEHVEPDAAKRFADLVARWLDGEPLAYLLGQQEFYGLPLRVNARVLVPRADTETLVDWALELLPAAADSGVQVLDLGTGSGAIALALKHHRPNCSISACDNSAQALQVAQANASRLGLAVPFVRSDWFTDVVGRFDVIVSNPPYIAQGDAHLPALRHEPRQALVAGADGLRDLCQIVQVAPAHLRPGGWLLLEHGYDQAAVVRGMLRVRGFSNISSRKDLAGIERCSGGQCVGQWPLG